MSLAVLCYRSRNSRILLTLTKFYTTNYGYAIHLDRACLTINNLLNFDLFHDYLLSIHKSY